MMIPFYVLCAFLVYVGYLQWRNSYVLIIRLRLLDLTSVCGDEIIRLGSSVCSTEIMRRWKDARAVLREQMPSPTRMLFQFHRMSWYVIRLKAKLNLLMMDVREQVEVLQHKET